MARTATSISIAHGGGPNPNLDPSQTKLYYNLKTLVPAALRLDTPEAPRAILVLSAHWETEVVTITRSAQPHLYYDYVGFPDEFYQFKYPAPGAPDVAEAAATLLRAAGITCELEDGRGWDHALFVPMMQVRPQADIPLVQVSVLASQDPEALFAIGRALAPLRDQGVAILGSGSSSFHNMDLFMGVGGPEEEKAARSRHAQFLETVHDCMHETDGRKRGDRLAKWRDWVGAYDAHPKDLADHFSPLVVVAGAAGNGSPKGWKDEALGWNMETFYWDGE